MYPHNTEVFNSQGGLEKFRTGKSKSSIGVRLRKAGYTTAFMGKYLNGYELDPSYVPPGWDEWFGLAGKKFLSGYDYDANHNGRMEHFGDRSHDYQTDVLRQRATEFVDEQADSDKPFLLTLFPTAPHSPIEPARRHRDNPFADDPIPDRKNFDEDLSDKPLWLRGIYSGPLTAKEKAASLKRYRNGLGALMAVDDMVASIASRLEADDALDNTVFIFTSDNGYSFGSHQWRGKLAPYDETTRVPLAIAGPGVREQTQDHLVAQIDLAPTLYDLAGLPDQPDVDGVSLAPLLRGEKDLRWRPSILIEYKATPAFPFHTLADVQRTVFRGGSGGGVVPDYRSVRTPKWQYIEWYAGDQHEYELYDMAEDPFQLTNLRANLATAAEHTDVAAELQDRLEDLAACSGADCR